MRTYIKIGLISIIFALYFFEGCLFIQKTTFYKKIMSSNFEKNSRELVYNELKKNNEKVVKYILTQEDLIFTKDDNIYFFGGISNTITISCNESGYYQIYKSDRYGFNNPDDEWNSNEIEYLIVGDSFAHGACVNRPYDIASVLRFLSKKNVLNLGWPGNGPLEEYATLREYLKTNVKKILWLYYEGNDLKDLSKSLKSPFDTYISNHNFAQNFNKKQHQIDENISIRMEQVNTKLFYPDYKSKIIDRLKKTITLYETRSIFSSETDPQPPLVEFKIILNLANDLATKNNSKIYFVYLPNFYRFKINKNFYKNEIKKIVSDLNITFIDIDDEVFKKEVNPLKLFPFEKLGHYNSEGYNKTAYKIFEKTK